MHKKFYVQPNIKVTELDMTPILADSDPTGETDPWLSRKNNWDIEFSDDIIGNN